ncbi:MAG: 50S ribosomal protein L17 [SAR202 cluster bacterium]|nr:50S ribosomal protein L17 [SAR202 cluster bacterium]
MRHGLSGRKLGRPTNERIAILKLGVASLIQHESIQTTEPKAKEIRRMAEKLITRSKGGTLHDRRMVAAVITDEKVVTKLFEVIGPRYKTRPGGYTRIMKTEPRKGDAAPMAILELVPEGK